VIPGSAPEASALGGSTQVTQARRAAPLYRPQICVITCPWLPRVRASGGRPKCQVLHARKCPWSRITSRVPLSAAGLCTRTPPARTLAAAVLSQGMAARPQIYAVRHAPRRPSFSGPGCLGATSTITPPRERLCSRAVVSARRSVHPTVRRRLPVHGLLRTAWITFPVPAFCPNFEPLLQGARKRSSEVNRRSTS